MKALIGSKGVRERRNEGLFVAEGAQSLKESLHAAPRVKHLYLTPSGRDRIEKSQLDISHLDIIDVSDDVMAAMSTTITPQGILALCELPLGEKEPSTFTQAIYLAEIQDPGNAGTIIRTADAMGITTIFTSPGSVDMYSPKVVRATAGSLWHVDIFEEVPFDTITAKYSSFTFLALSGAGKSSIEEVDFSQPTIAVFGNEARGLDQQYLSHCSVVHIPMKGRAESLNLSAAAAIVMYRMAQS